MVVGHFQIDDLGRRIVAQLRADLAQRGDEACRRRVEILGGVGQVGRPCLLQFRFGLANLAGGIVLVVPFGLHQQGHGNPLLHLAPLDRQDFEFLPAAEVLVGPIPLCQLQALSFKLGQFLRLDAKEFSRPGDKWDLFAGLRVLDFRAAEIEKGNVLLVGRQPQCRAQREGVDQQQGFAVPGIGLLRSGLPRAGLPCPACRGGSPGDPSPAP